MCDVSGFFAVNESYCSNGTDLISPSTAVGRVSSSEDFYKLVSMQTIA